MKVLNSTRITPNMHRVRLGGEGLETFPQDQSGAYIKFMFPEQHARKPIVRTYTVRHQSKDGLDIDFALHGSAEETGPATKWAISAKAGDTVLMGGPGPAKPLPNSKGPFLLIGDMTALPAISVNIENLPNDAAGHAILLICQAEDKQELIKPVNVTIECIIDPDLGANAALLDEAARQLSNISDYSYAWVACEFEAMKRLRQFLRFEQNFGKERLYISSYWKRGLIEDEHKSIKRADAQTVS